MTKTPDIWDLSDEQITEELGRMGWVRDASWATKEESELALTQEALRRILKLLIKGVTKQMQISKEEKRGIVINWFLKHSYEEFSIYDRDVDELLRNLEKEKEKGR